MVEKKCKHGHNTGNTLRRNLLHNLRKESSACITFQNLDAAQSEIQARVEEEFINEATNDSPHPDPNYAYFLQTLAQTFEVVSYFTDTTCCENGVEFSLDKRKRWDLMENLEASILPNLWFLKPVKDSSKTFPFELKYIQSSNYNCKAEYAQELSFRGVDIVSGASVLDKPLPYDLSWKRQQIYHNQRSRNDIQRKSHLLRAKKTSAFPSPPEVQESFVQNYGHKWCPLPCVTIQVNRGDSNLSKTLSNIPAVWIDDKIPKKKDRVKEDLVKIVGPNKDDSDLSCISTFETFTGPKSGKKNPYKAVKLVPQSSVDAYHNLKEAGFLDIPYSIFNRISLYDYICASSTKEGKSFESFLEEKTKSSDTVWKKCTVQKNDTNENKDDMYPDISQTVGERRRVKKQIKKQNKKEKKRMTHAVYILSKNLNKYVYGGVQGNNFTHSQIPQYYEEEETSRDIIKELIEMHSSKKKRSKHKKGVSRSTASQSKKGLTEAEKEVKFFQTELSMLSLTDGDFTHSQGNKKHKIHSSVPKSVVKPEQSEPIRRTNVPIWKVISEIVEPSKQPGQEISLQKCEDRQCSVRKVSSAEDSNAITGKLVPVPPNVPNKTYSQLLNNDNKNTTQLKSTLAAESNTIESVIKSKTSKKRKKKKDIAQDSLDILIQQDPNVVQTKLFPTGILAKVKASTLQSTFLENRYGSGYQESHCKPRRLLFNISDSVKDIIQAGENNGLDLPFMNIHGILIVEILDIKLLQTQFEKQTKDKNVPHENVLLHLKSDFGTESKAQLYNRLEDKIKPHLLYPLPKLVEYFIEVYKVLANEGAAHVEQSMSRSSVGSGIRQYEWLYTLCPWEYDILPAYDTYKTFLTKRRDSLQSPQTPRLQSPISPMTVNHRNNSTNTRRAVGGPRNDKDAQLSYTQCGVCNKIVITRGDFNAISSDPALLSKIQQMTGTKWSLRYTQASGCEHTVCDVCLHGHILQQIADKQGNICCPIAGCVGSYDSAAILSVVSLVKYCRHLRNNVDLSISSHPQWSWCPSPKCDKAAKVHASAMLGECMVIECVCGEAWCFRCDKAAHWPALCDQADIYWQLREKSSVDGEFMMSKITCTHCLAKSRNYTPKPPSSPRPPTYRHGSKNHTNNIQIGHVGEVTQVNPNCQCVFVFCENCLDLGESFSLRVPKVILENKSVSLSSSMDTILPVLLYREAHNHSHVKQRWLPSVTEAKAAILARQIVKSKSRGYQSGMQRSSTNLHLAPSVGTEKLFLALIYQFVYQAHCFLEYVYVVLMFPGAMPTETRSTVLHDVAVLEQTIMELDKALHSLRYSPGSLMARLKQLYERGRSIMSRITSRVQHLSSPSGAKLTSQHLLRLSANKMKAKEGRSHTT